MAEPIIGYALDEQCVYLFSTAERAAACVEDEEIWDFHDAEGALLAYCLEPLPLWRFVLHAPPPRFEVVSRDPWHRTRLQERLIASLLRNSPSSATTIELSFFPLAELVNAVLQRRGYFR